MSVFNCLRAVYDYLMSSLRQSMLYFSDSTDIPVATLDKPLAETGLKQGEVMHIYMYVYVYKSSRSCLFFIS